MEAEKLKILTMLELEITQLFERISRRRAEYISVLGLKRTREHFQSIFGSRLGQIEVRDLKLFPVDLITAFYDFNKQVETLHWYLYSTEDMPATIQDYVDASCKRLERKYLTLTGLLSVEKGEFVAATQPQETLAEAIVLEESEFLPMLPPSEEGKNEPN